VWGREPRRMLNDQIMSGTAHTDEAERKRESAYLGRSRWLRWRLQTHSTSLLGPAAS
jgi:hypothetical protein